MSGDSARRKGASASTSLTHCRWSFEEGNSRRFHRRYWTGGGSATMRHKLIIYPCTTLLHHPVWSGNNHLRGSSFGGAAVYGDIQKQGAEAARKGLSILNCPYLRADAMPAHTGEPIAQWRGRVEAWRRDGKRCVPPLRSVRRGRLPRCTQSALPLRSLFADFEDSGQRISLFVARALPWTSEA
ncbi:CrpP-related protein [Achromobacter kerstersii]|uniref:CrpP-related protein n=1 Tax=Achromobacter kerstersii TaxID=1353890 RepID=UPI0030B8670E